MDELTAAIVSNHDGEAANPSIRQPVTALDEAVYRKLAASMRSERLEQLYALNLSHTEARITRMRQAASNQEDAAYRREAHAIQGGCGMVGAVELQKLAASLEERGIDANHVASLDELAVAWNRLRRILVARKAGRQAGPAEGGRTE
jgi:HPt (histidine-containing phosphotransfer) domain-containing protein